ncbi:MAG: HAD family phosphatase [Pyramidobacter porci]|nr:HAD family phosphatase [Pyramidobacter porci]MDY2647665.1 HAD family phosphatase [Pyramidobacter porci]
MEFAGALFDLDGTLIDSADVWARIDAEFLRRRGLAVPDDYMCAVSSKKFSEAAVYTIARFGLDETAEALAAEWLEMARREYGSGVFLRPHAGEYLRWLKARGVKLGTVTGLPHSLAEAALKNNGVYALFDAFTSADETPRGKEHRGLSAGGPPSRCHAGGLRRLRGRAGLPRKRPRRRHEGLRRAQRSERISVGEHVPRRDPRCGLLRADDERGARERLFSAG